MSASRKRRLRRWTTTSVWSVNRVRRAAQKSSTASVKLRMTSPSKSLEDWGRGCLYSTDSSIEGGQTFAGCLQKKSCSRPKISSLFRLFRFYIGCDRCQNWYHGRCVGILQSEANHIDEYVCPQCQSTEDAMTVFAPLTDKDYEGLRRTLRSLQVCFPGLVNQQWRKTRLNL